ncbi:hypothetical protein [Caudoviricetes sp.]|nr:hypothetical protein [Caudoviricetes sp.]
MATGTMKWFAQGIHDLGNKIHDLDTDTFQMGIVTTATVPAVNTAAPHWGGTGTTNFATNQVSEPEVSTGGGGYLWLYAGGGKSDWERKRKKLLESNKENVEEAVEVIEEIAKELPKAPVTELRQELKSRDIVFDEEYKKLLKMLIKAEIEAQKEQEDEESLLMLL